MSRATNAAAMRIDPLEPEVTETLVASFPVRHSAEQLSLLRDLAQIFCDEAPSRLAAIRTAIVRRNGEALASEAKGLREPLTFLRAWHADSLAEELEDRGYRQDFNGATGSALMLSLEINRLRYRLLDFAIAVHTELRRRQRRRVPRSA